MKQTLLFFKCLLPIVWGSGAAFLWTMGGPVYDLYYGAALSLLLAAAVWLPWHKVKWLRFTLNIITAVTAFFAAGLWLTQDVLPSSPAWSVWLWMAFILVVLCVIGRTALQKSVWLPAATLVFGLLFLSALSLGDADLSNIEAPRMQSYWKLAIDLPILLGGTLTNEFETQNTTAKWSALIAAGLWFTTSLTASLVWNYEAATLLPNPVTAAWGRISVFSIFSHPQLPMISLLAAASLWHCAKTVCQIISLYRNKVLLYNKRIVETKR